MGNMRDRLQRLTLEAQIRGPVQTAEEERAALESDFPLLKVEPKLLPVLDEDDPALQASTDAERAAVAQYNAGLDVESFLIQPGRKVPRLVVCGYQAPTGQQAIVTGDPHDPTRHARAFLAFTEPLVWLALRKLATPEQVVKLRVEPLNELGRFIDEHGIHAYASEALELHQDTWLTRDVRLINQNIAFDFSVIAEDAHQADIVLGWVGDPERSLFDKVMRRIFELLDLGIVEDTLYRERLIDLAEGTLDKDYTSLTNEGNPRRKKYNLKAQAKTYLGVDMDKVAWRYGYRRFYMLPIEEYPEGARDYVVGDVEKALHVAVRQQERGELHGLEKGARIPNSSEQSKSGFALQLVSAWGMRTDRSLVQQLDADLDVAEKTMSRVLKEHGLIRTIGKDVGSRDMKLIHALVKKTYEEAGLPVPLTKPKRGKGGGRISTAGSTLEDIALIKLRGHSQDVLDADGRIDETELFKHPLYCLSQHTSITKLQNTYLPVLYTGTKHPICTNYQNILETGRISSYDPNLNNLPRGGTKTALQRLQARVRQCFVPRPGFVFCSVDFNMFELVTLAQCLIWFFGESKMADAINAGLDLHTLFAAEQLLHVSYDEAKKLIKDKNKHAVDMRQLSKAANFGLPGGLSAATFSEYAKASYNVYVDEDDARELKQKWLMMWPEMVRYFRLISSMMRGYDEHGQSIGTLEQFVSGRIRGRVRYCAMANSAFQGLAADAAKRALYEIQRHSYLLGGRMYGSRTVGFYYDEFFMEHPEKTAHERALVQTEIALQYAQELCPDVKLKAGPALMRNWYKEADAVYDASGRLIPWMPELT